MTVGLMYSDAWSQSVLQREPILPAVEVQQPADIRSSLPVDSFGFSASPPAVETTGESVIDDLSQDTAVPAEQSEEGVDLLMRAPLHEAFAEIPLSAPLPNPVIARQPPVAIEELPPDYKPEGDNIVWISGYWFWDEEREDYIWVSGVWRDAPVGQQWIEGYWHDQTDSEFGAAEYRWVNGFWQSTETTALNYLPQPPAPIEAGPSMPSPSEDYFYVPGNWTYQESRYLWRPGYYTVCIEDLVWVPPCYVWTPCGYLFRPGYWDKPIQERGVVFAPVYFREPVYLQPNYFFRPTCTIDTGLAILPHLFVRRNRCHYYFGDWYADRYVQNDFCGWSNLGNHGFYHQQYDPLFNYYSSPVCRLENQSLVHWARRQHRHCQSNIGLRPPIVFNLSIVNQQFSNLSQADHDGHDQGHGLNLLPTNQVFLGDSLGRRAKLASLNSLDREAQRFVRIDARQQKNELEAIDRQLQKQRQDAERQLAKSQRANSQNTLVQPTQVQIGPTALTIDPVRQARMEKEAIRRQENQTKIRERQAEATAIAQTRKLERDQQKIQNDLENQVREQNRLDKRGNPASIEQLGQMEGRDNPRTLSGGQPLTNPSPNELLDPRVQRQLQVDQRKQAQQMSQQERDQRKQAETAQRQAESAQRQAAEAMKRQQPNGQILGNQPLNNPSTGQIDPRVQRQLQIDQRKQAQQMSQQERDQRMQAETAQRQAESVQRQAAEAMKRQPNEQVQRAQEAQQQRAQQERGQQRAQQESQQQGEMMRRQAETQQRQAAEAMKRQQNEQARQQQDAIRQQQAQQAAQQRQAEMMQRQAEAQQRQAQEAAQRAAEKAQRDQDQQQRKQEREKKKD